MQLYGDKDRLNKLINEERDMRRDLLTIKQLKFECEHDHSLCARLDILLEKLQPTYKAVCDEINQLQSADRDSQTLQQIQALEKKIL